MNKEDYYAMSDLILLIGTNPLPNYVAAKYFLDNHPDIKNIWLVYSEATKFQSSTLVYAESIEKVIRNNFQGVNNGFEFKFLPLRDVDNAQLVRNDFQILISKLEQNAIVHLNYTGGTKVMVAHIHEMLSDQHHIKTEFSYLSPKSFRLIDDNGKCLSDDLRKTINLNFEDLISLHGFERINRDKIFPFENAVNIFGELIDNGELDTYYDIAKGGYRRSNYENNNKSLISDKKGLLKHREAKTIAGSFLRVNNSLPEDYKLFNDEGSIKDEQSLFTDNELIKNIVKFFDGGWLEMYIYKILSEELKSYSQLKIYNNWQIRKPNWEKINPNLNFELDVIIMYGYQLCGISCTTDRKKSICKSKGFEIILRTEQIGGDESKTIFVTLAEDNTVAELQEELSIETGSTENILVLGKNDLRKNYLIKKIKQFMGD